MKTKLTLFSLRLFFLTCFLWAGDKGLNAQFPVTTQITLPVPHPLSLKDFSGANGQFSLKLKVQLHNIEISDRHFFVRLHLLNNHGLHIQTAPYAPIPPILLEGGFPTELSDLDLEPYFDPENLLFEGISKHQYLRQQQLPQGIYRIYFQIVESLSNKTINNPRAEQRIFPVVLGQPPLLIHPQDQAALPITEPPNIRFQWMPRHLAIAGTAGHTTYRFRLVEMLDENISPYIQIHQDPPLLEVEQSATQLLYGVEYPPLLQNQLYAWRVEALVKNPDGSIRPVIQNPEKSQVRTFRYVPPCPPVPPLQIAQEDLQNVSLYWVKQEPHQEYTLSYRMRPKNRNWNKVTTSNSSMLLSDLAQGTVYQYKLEAKCAFAPAPFPQVLTDTTLTMEQAQKIGGCDAPEDLTPKSTIPLKKLLLQETFTTGAGRVHVTRLNSQHSEEGRYSGEGWMYFTPFLPPGAKLAVTFENIFINENRQHVGTEPVVAVRKKSRLDFFTQPTFIEDADPLVIEGQGSRVAGTVTRANFQAGKLVLSTEEGKEIHFKPRKDKPTMVTDDNNAQYVATTTGDIWGTLLSDRGKQEESEGEGEEEQAAAQDTGVQKSDKTSTDKPSAGTAPTVQDNFSLKGLEGVHFTISKQTQRFLDNFFQADESFKLYETLSIAGAEYTVPYKLVIVGETDFVRLESNAATKEMLREGKIVFIDPENPTQELTARPNLTLEVAHDNPKKPKSLFALYKKSDKQKIIVGKIIIHAFEQKSKKLYIVPVWEELSWNREEAAKEFQKIYHPAGIAWEVSYLPVLKSVKGLNHRKTVFSSQGLESSEIYSDDMFRVHKAFHKDLEEKEKQKQKQEKKEQKKQEKKQKKEKKQQQQEKQETKLDKEGYYLFVVPQGTNGEELGYWPKKRPYGYLFSDKIGGRNSYLLAKYIAHEVGHGAFNLFHTFSEANRYKIPSGLTSNLMDYNLSLNSGTYREHQLFQYQWHQIHKPLNITGWIQEQEENKVLQGDEKRKMAKVVFPNIKFFKQTTKKYGFDKNDIKTVTDYNKKNIFAGNTFEVPWQMVRLNYTGTDNNVDIEVKTKKNEICNKLFLIPENEIITDGFKPSPSIAVQITGSNQVAITPRNKSSHSISVIGMGKGQSGFKVVKDSIKGELIGAANILTADERNQNVYIVTVHLNKTGKPDTSIADVDLKKGNNYLSSYISFSELSSISTNANEIYNQALLNINFIRFNTYMHKFANAICLDFDLNNDDKIDASITTGFTSEQKKIISEFGKYYSINVDDKVLFIVDKPAFPSIFATNQFVLGIMERNKQFGFIYKDVINREGKSLEQVISHELGHGFNLLHPEQCPNLGNMPIPNNIMNADIDNTGKVLIFYQWIQLLRVGK